MGIGTDGGLLPPPSYLGAQLPPDYWTQAQIASQLQNWNGPMPQQRSAVLAAYRPAVMKMDAATKKFCAELPLRVAQRILSIELHEDTKDRPMCIVVRYNNFRETIIEDVDSFPSDEHISRIMLECP